MRGRAHTIRMALASAGALAVAGLSAPSGALAGRLFVTGHDADSHCAAPATDPRRAQCQLLARAVAFARAGAPDANRPVLIVECRDQLSRALINAFTSGPPPRESVCPGSPRWFSTVLSPKNYSAIVFGSSLVSLNAATDPQAAANPVASDSDRIVRRRAEIRTFFNSGGGVVALAGGPNGDGDPGTGPDVYYGFLPLPAGIAAGDGPFSLTPDANELGLSPDDAACCEPRNAFAEPGQGVPLRAAERGADSPGPPVTLFGEADVNDAGRLVASPPVTAARVVKLPARSRCLDARYRVRIVQPPGVDVVTATAYFGRRVARTVRVGTFAAIRFRRMPRQRRVTLRVVATTATGHRVELDRTISRCR